MKNVTLDFSCLESQEEIHAILKETLEFPAYYGDNLDALYDCLTDISEDVVITAYYTADGSPAAAYLKKVQQVFIDAEKENPHLAAFFLISYETE